MFDRNGVSRRSCVAGITAAVAGGYATVRSPRELWASAGLRATQPGGLAPRGEEEDYDLLAKLHYKENPYGPPESVLKAMNRAFKYANRYGYPDGDIVQAIAKHHGVDPKYVVLGAGSGEILDVVGS